MSTFLKALPVLIPLVGLPLLVVVGLILQWYRRRESDKNKKQFDMEYDRFMRELQSRQGKDK